MKRKLPLIISVTIMLTLLAVYFNAALLAPPANVIITGKQLQVCNRNFLSYELTQAPAGVNLVKGRLEHKNLILPVLVPRLLTKENSSLVLVAQVNSSL